MNKMNQFLIKKDSDGNEYAELNPAYEEKYISQRYELFLKKSGIPSFYYDIEFKDFQGNKKSEEYKKVVYYTEHIDEEQFKHVNLYLYGTHSSQKTAVAINILKGAIRKGLNAKFVLAGTLIDMLLKLQGFNINDEIYSTIKSYKNCDILCIDDIFDPDKTLLWKNSESKNIIILEWDKFLRELLASDTKIIMTSNFGIEIIKTNFGDSLYELVDRNFVSLQFMESIKKARKLKVADAFKNMEKR